MLMGIVSGSGNIYAPHDPPEIIGKWRQGRCQNVAEESLTGIGWLVGMPCPNWWDCKADWLSHAKEVS